MRKHLLILVAVFSIILTANTQAATFTDVQESHWAYTSIEAMAQKGVINGMGDGTFNPSGVITREQFAKLITACLLDNIGTFGDCGFTDVYNGSWSKPYIDAAVASGIINPSDYENGLFEPGKPIDRGTVALWISRGMGIEGDFTCTFSDVTDSELKKAVGIVEAEGITKGYPDGTFKPNGTLTRAEAAEFISRIYTKNEQRLSVRPDSKQLVEFADGVIMAESSSSKNTIASIDKSSKTVVFGNADSVIKSLSEGDVLYMPQCEGFKNGLIGKVKAVSENGNKVSVTLSEPAIEDVIKSIDVSRVVTPEGMHFENTDGFTVGSANARNVGNAHYSENVVKDEDGRLLSWKMTLYETPSAKPIHFEYKKNNLKFDFDLYISALIDIKSEGFMLDIKDLDMKAIVTTKAVAAAEYSSTFEAGGELKLPKATVPVAGPIAISITPKITVDVSGNLNVTASITLENKSGIEFDSENGFRKVFQNEPPKAELDAKADGTLKVGPAIDVELGLIDTPLFDSADFLEGSFSMGIGITCNTSIRREAKLTFSDDSPIDYVKYTDENGVVHLCDLCFDGEIFNYDSYRIGLSSELKDILKKYAGIEVKDLSGNLPDFKFADWYCSNGSWDSPEFGFGNCPHKIYKITVTARDYYTGYPLVNAAISVDGSDVYWTDDKGKAYIYLADGVHKTVSICEKYEKTNGEIHVKSKAAEADVVLMPLTTDNATDTDKSVSPYLVRAKSPDGKLYGYVDVRTGYYAIEPRFDKADEAFGEDGYAYVKIGSYPSVINTRGEELYDFGTVKELALDQNGMIQIPVSDTSIYLYNGSRFVKELTPPSQEIARIDTGGAYINGESRTPTKLIVIRGYTADKKMYYIWYDENGNFIYMTTEKCNMAKDIDCYYCITENKVVKIDLDGTVTEVMSDKGSYIAPIVYSGYRWYTIVHKNSLNYQMYSNGFTPVYGYYTGRGYGIGVDNGIVVTIMPQVGGWSAEYYHKPDGLGGTNYYRSSKSDGFWYGYAKVSYGSKREDGRWTSDDFFGYIDSDGNELLEVGKANIDNYSNPLKDGYYIYKKDGLFGINKLDGTAVMWPAYKELYDMK